MKDTLLLLLSLSIVVILLSNNTKYTHAKDIKKQETFFTSTLDSLQGTWKNEDDTLNVLIIEKRTWISEYPFNNVLTRDTVLSYFSDTVVAGDTLLFSQLDTTAVTGEYLIDVLPLANGQGFHNFGCWEILYQL